jgi:hypothetical protein
METLALCFVGSSLGILGAAFAVSKHLHTFSAAMLTEG